MVDPLSRTSLPTTPVNPTTPKSNPQPKGTTWATFNSNWQARVGQFSKIKGFDVKAYLKPVWQDDLSRVKQGKKPYTNSQVADFAWGLKEGKAPVSKKSSSHGGVFGFLGNAVSDVGSVAQGLNPLNLVPALGKEAVSADAVLSRVIGEAGGLVGNKDVTKEPVTNFLDKIQTWLPGYTQAEKKRNQLWDQLNKSEAKNGVIKATGQALTNVPGARDVPGAYTLGNIAQGTPGQLAQHPIFTLLDVLPIAGHVGEAAAGLKFGEDTSLIPKGSAWEALADGKSLRGLTRATGITGEGSKIESLARSIGVSSDIRDASRYQAQTLREGAVNPKFQDIRDGYGKIASVAMQRVEKAKAAIEKAETTPGWKVTGIMKSDLAKATDAMDQAFHDVKRVSSADFIDYVRRNHSVDSSILLDQFKNEGMTPYEAESFLAGNYTDLYDWAGRWSVGKSFKDMITDGNGTDLKGQMVPKYMTKALDKLRTTTKSNAASRLYGGATNIFRYAVLTGPRHLAHVLFSNGMFMGLDDMGVFKPSTIKDAFDMVHNPELWPQGLQKGVGTYSKDIAEEVRNMKPEELHGIAQGKTMGRVLKDFANSPLMKKTPLAILNPLNYRRAEEFFTDMSRAMEYVTGANKALADDPRLAAAQEAIDKARSELGPTATNSMNLAKAEKAYRTTFDQVMSDTAHQAGLKQSIKVLMDVDGMAPIERQVLRQVMPFYPFTRQLLSYMMKFPADHPVKAAVLASIGRQEMSDAGTGLPMKFMSLFPIAGTDSNGNALFIDTKSMNPFRSMNGLSPFTRAGFLSELNPLITAIPAASGLNILTASPELYPNLTVDPVTGDLVAKPNQSLLQTVGEQLVPQLATVDAMMGWSKNLASLKSSDPQAYQRLLLSNLNLPFSIGPRNINSERIRFARNQYTAAQQDVTNKDYANYNYVPYQGAIYTPANLQRLLSGK